MGLKKIYVILLLLFVWTAIAYEQTQHTNMTYIQNQHGRLIDLSQSTQNSTLGKHVLNFRLNLLFTKFFDEHEKVIY